MQFCTSFTKNSLTNCKKIINISVMCAVLHFIYKKQSNHQQLFPTPYKIFHINPQADGGVFHTLRLLVGRGFSAIP